MDVIFTPSIAWKVNDVTAQNFCTRKGPTFNFLGVKWKLKFVYSATAGGNKCSLVLKTCASPEHNVPVSVSTYLEGSGSGYLTVNFCLANLKIGKWIIWENTASYIEQYYKNGHITPFDSIWKEAFFRCNMSVKVVEPKNIRHEEDSNLPSIEYSPCIESLSQDFKFLFNNPSMSDITLECANKTIYAHSVILAARSPVFENMIRNGKELQSKVYPIVVKDVEPLVMEQLVQYLYYGKIALDSKTVYKLYVAADMYGVDVLKTKCGLFMMGNKDLALDTASEEKVTEKSKIESGKAYFECIKGIVKTKEWEKFSKIYPKCANKALLLLVKENSV